MKKDPSVLQQWQAVMADSLSPACSCPSGDGSLRHPCPTHATNIDKVDALAQFIRTIDGQHRMGAGALAEAICGRFHVTEASS